MVDLNNVIRYLNSILKPRAVPDSSRNGLQFRGKKNVKKIGFAVDACIETFEKANKLGCDLLVVHHGILWKGQRGNDSLERRKRLLKRFGLSLYACHLPLDMHPEYGNNIGLARLLELKNLKDFGGYHGVTIGYSGKTDLSLKNIELNLNKKLKTKSKVLNFSNKKISQVGLVSGGGWSAIPEAIEKRIDLLIVGEAPHHAYHMAKEGNLNLIIAGHYATETLGVKALMKPLKEKFNIQTVFIDVPTGL